MSRRRTVVVWPEGSEGGIKMGIRPVKSIYIACLLASAAVPTAAYAQSPQPSDQMAKANASAAGSADTGQVEEIVVTAQKRRENLQIVPISVTAISADVAAEKGVTDTASLSS